MTPRPPESSRPDTLLPYAPLFRTGVLRAAIELRDGRDGTPVLVGREGLHEKLRAMGVADAECFEVHNSVNSPHVPQMVDILYERLQRRGYLRRDVERMVNREIGRAHV